MFDLLIFDCDGTLVDSEYMNNLATIQLLHEQGLTQYGMDYAFAHFVGIRQKHILADISRETGHVFPPDMGKRYVERVHALAPLHLKKIPGAEELVGTAARKTKICVASNGQRDNVISSLDMTGLKKYFEDAHIFTGLQVENAKPAPDLFLLAARTMGVAPARCVVIEDSVAGVTGAKAAGMHTLGFTGAHENREAEARKLETAGADEVFSSLIHIRERFFP